MKVVSQNWTGTGPFVSHQITLKFINPLIHFIGVYNWLLDLYNGSTFLRVHNELSRNPQRSDEVPSGGSGSRQFALQLQHTQGQDLPRDGQPDDRERAVHDEHDQGSKQ